jgi:hypothetical protein
MFVVNSAFSQDNQNFNSPEDVIQYFVTNLKDGNFNNIFHTLPFNNDSLIGKINTIEAIKYFDAFLPQDHANFPIQYYSIIKYNFLGNYAFQIKKFIFNLLLSEEYSKLKKWEPLSIYKNDIINESLINNYFLLLDLENLETLELVRIDISKPDIQFSERSKRNTERFYKNVYGCDEKIEYIVLYKNNGKYYVGGITVLRYGTNWYIFNLRCEFDYFEYGSLEQVSGILEYLINYNIK